MTKRLHINETLALPLSAVTEKLAFLGRTGSGKTFAATKLAELMLEAGAQVVALDPVGKWYGLRLAGDGDGFEIPVFGGLHGDLPLEAGAGALVADTIVDRDLSAVIDVSQMNAAEQHRFASAFAKRLFQRKKTSSSAMHLFIEECQEFVPQNPQRDETATLHEFQRIFKIGRNFGIGGSLISQRPQEVNKKALNQTECLFAFQMTGPQERDAMAKWMGEKGIDPKIASDLPGLTDGQCLVWSPAWLKVNTRTRFASKRTADVSSTPTVGKRSKAAATLTPIDIAELKTAMAATIARADAEDPKKLRARIAELEKQLLSRAPAPAAKTATIKVEVPVLKDSHVTGLQREIARVEKVAEKVIAAGREISAQLERSATACAKAAGFGPVVVGAVPPVPAVGAHAPARASAPVRVPAPPRARATSDSEGNGEAKLRAGERAIVQTLRRFHPEALPRERIGPVIGIQSRGTTFGTYISVLKRAGLIEEANRSYTLTQHGVAYADSMPVLDPPTRREILEKWNGLRAGERAILVAVVDEGEIDRATLGEVVGIDARGTTMGTYLSVLKRNDLIVESRGLYGRGPALEAAS